LNVTTQLQHLFIPALQHRETQADELQMQSARVPGTREIIFPEDTLQNFSYRLPNKQCKTVFYEKNHKAVSNHTAKRSAEKKANASRTNRLKC